MPNDRIVAFIDLGTNSARLLLVSVAADGSTTTLSQQKEVIRLGEGEFASRRLQKDAMDRAVAVCGRFAEMARARDASEIIAVATSATREASNRGAFLERMRREAKINLHVISGKEEARLIYLGVASGTRIDNQKALFIDIGGGSTEVVLGNQSEHFFIDSLKLGAIRLTSMFFEPGFDGPVSKATYRRLTEHVRHKTLRAVQALGKHKIDLAIGSSGTIQNMVDLTARQTLGRPAQRDDAIATADLSRMIEELCDMPLAARRKAPGINPDRADIIIAGAAILEPLLTQLKVPSIRASERGLREGLLIDYLARSARAVPLTSTSFRERSVLRLGRTCSFDEPHALQVARLSLMLFESARDLGLHQLGPAERELLEYAALLHDVGTFVSYANHQVHSHYLIRHGELLGFDDREISLIALIARYHQKSYPGKSLAEFAALPDEDQRMVEVCCTLLRLAECLDRSHMGAVTAARFEAGQAKGAAGQDKANGKQESDARKSEGKNGKSRVTLIIEAAADCRMEVWGVHDRAKAFRKTFDKHLDVRISEALAESKAVK
ncbi:MAG: Ppx/GppA family phosphatase [Phycisphaerales bacterium]|nr:Ppx/GppA family phosphatase [Phycisphaerales bacterium]